MQDSNIWTYSWCSYGGSGLNSGIFRNNTGLRKKGLEPPKVPHFTKKELYKSVKPRVMTSSNHPVAILYIEVVFDDHSTFGFHYPLYESLGWVPRNFKILIFKPKLSFLSENHKNDH